MTHRRSIVQYLFLMFGCGWLGGLTQILVTQRGWDNHTVFGMSVVFICVSVSLIMTNVHITHIENGDV